MALETMSDAIRRLEEAGYHEQFRAEGGQLVSEAERIAGPPEEFGVDEVVRFEGESDPADEAAVFALTHRPTSTRGTYTVTYGSEMDPVDAEMAQRLG